jgi:outer membrane protein, heavy metal efflux system
VAEIAVVTGSSSTVVWSANIPSDDVESAVLRDESWRHAQRPDQIAAGQSSEFPRRIEVKGMGKDTPKTVLSIGALAVLLSGCQTVGPPLRADLALDSAGTRVCSAPLAVQSSDRIEVAEAPDTPPVPDQQPENDNSHSVAAATGPSAFKEQEAVSLGILIDTPDSTPEPLEVFQVVSSSVVATIEPGITLKQLEQLALQHNPTIRQQSAAATRAAGIQQQSGTRPNPIVGYSGAQLADRGTDQQGVFIEQQIVLGDKLDLNRQVHQQDVQIQLWQLEAQRQRVLTDVRRLFYQALAAQRRLELTKDFHARAGRAAELVQMRKDALHASQPDVLQARIQLNRVVLAQRQADIELTAVWRKLSASTGDRNLERSALQGSLDPLITSYDWDLAYEDLCSRSPELAAARTSVQRARVYLCRQQRQPIPNLNFQLAAGRDNGTNNGFLNVQAVAPIPVFNKNEGNIRAAYAAYCRSTHEVRRIELSLQSRLADASREFDSAAASVEIHRDEIIPHAQETIDLSEQAYAAGEYEFLQVLVARRTFFESNLRYVEALGALAQANAGIEGLMLSGGLMPVSDFTGDDALRGQALDGR